MSIFSSERKVRKAKKMFAILMLPIFMFQMMSVNILLADIAFAQVEDGSVAIKDAEPKATEKATELKEEKVVTEEKKVESKKESFAVEVVPVVEPEKIVADEQVSGEIDNEPASISPTPSDASDVPVIPSEPTAIVESISSSESEVVEPAAASIIPEAPKPLWNTEGKVASTNFPVVVGKTYIAPQNDKVQITFTKLPENPKAISIEEIELTEKQMTETGALSNKAYDIISDMENGSFEFELSLPLPKVVRRDQVEIKYAEKIADLPNAESTEKDEKVKEEIDAQKDTLIVKGVDHLTIFYIAATVATPLIADTNVAQGLGSLSAERNAAGFPLWYQENNNGLKLALCDNAADANCAGPTAGEMFYWSAESTIPMPGGGDAQLIMALEATDTTGEVDGGKAVFTRIRIRIDVPVDGQYTIIYPFGNQTFNATAADGIDESFDIDPTPGLFEQALTVGGPGGGGIGPFLTAVSPAAPAGYIGNPALEQTVTGSPNNKNYFEVQGPVGANFDGVGHNTVRNDSFIVLGKIYVDPSILAVGVNSQVADTLTPTLTGTYGGNNVTGISVSVAGQNIGAATLDTANKTWSKVVPAGTISLDGTYEVVATVTDATLATAIDGTSNELTIDRSPAPPITNQTGLASKSPLINSQTRFPEWYQDTLGTKLQLCADPANPMCLADGVISGNALSEQTGFGGEAFYWNGESFITFPNGGQALLVMALESAYGTGDPAANEQMVFARIRVRIDAPVAGDYTVTHPFGSKTYLNVPAGINTINDTIDIGTVTIGTFPGAFDSALGGNVGPFLKAVSPAPPTGYIGSPLVEQTVKGSPFGTNYFKIDGPTGADLGGIAATPDVIQKNTFTLSGKLFVEPPVGTLSVSVTPQNSNISTPVITGGVSDPTATVSVSVGGQDVSATVNATTGAWTASVPTALADGTYDVIATASNGLITAIDATINELVINTAPDTTGLTAVGPTAPTGFPYWYQDNSGLRLTLCNNNDPLCITTPPIVGNPTSIQSGFGDEAFYWNGTSIIDLPGGGQAKLVTGLEAAYANGSPEPDEQMVFTRVRIIMDAPVAGTYVITHPFGTKTYNVTPAEVGVGAITDTVDMGAVSVKTLSSAFNLALNGNIGPFLIENDPAVVAPAGYIGDPGVEQLVMGSPNGTNFFRVQGPAGSNFGGNGIDFMQNDRFNLSGKIFVPTTLEVTLNNTNPTVTLNDPTQLVTVNIADETTAPTINADPLINGGAGVLPQITINSALANIVIPEGTTVTSADPTWNGVIEAPTATTVTLPQTPGQTTTLGTAVEIGFADAMLSFDKGVRILLPGQAGKKVGYVRPGTTFTEITNICSADNQTTGNALAAGGDCKINVGADLVVWTKHFTTFATFVTDAAPTISALSFAGRTGGVNSAGDTVEINLSGIVDDADLVKPASITLSEPGTLTINIPTPPGDPALAFPIPLNGGINSFGSALMEGFLTDPTTNNKLEVIDLVNGAAQNGGVINITGTLTDAANNSRNIFINISMNPDVTDPIISAMDFANRVGDVVGNIININLFGVNQADLDAVGSVTVSEASKLHITFPFVGTLPIVDLNSGLNQKTLAELFGFPLAITPVDLAQTLLGFPSGIIPVVGTLTDLAGNITDIFINLDMKGATTTVITCPTIATYTGSAIEPCTATVTGLGLSQSVPVTYADNTSVGTATANAAFAENAGYRASSDSKTFQITNETSITVVTCPVSVVYSGSAQTPCSAIVTGAGGLNQSVAVTYINNTNAGTATASATYPGDVNHSSSSDSETFQITKAALTITANNQTKEFGAADPVFTFTPTGFVNGENASVTDVAPTCGVTVPHASVGFYPIVCSGAVDNNYSFSFVDGTLTVIDTISPTISALSFAGKDGAVNAAGNTIDINLFGITDPDLVKPASITVSEESTLIVNLPGTSTPAGSFPLGNGLTEFDTATMTALIAGNGLDVAGLVAATASGPISITGTLTDVNGRVTPVTINISMVAPVVINNSSSNNDDDDDDDDDDNDNDNDKKDKKKKKANNFMAAIGAGNNNLFGGAGDETSQDVQQSDQNQQGAVEGVQTEKDETMVVDDAKKTNPLIPWGIGLLALGSLAWFGFKSFFKKP